MRSTLHLTLFVCILTTSLGIGGCPSGGIRVRSWEDAIGFALSELEAVGDLEGRLEGYARTAADVREKIDVLDQVRPALDLINRLRDVDVPLIGNAWRALLALLSLATVDGAKIIGKLEETLTRLTKLKSSLENLTDLPDVADAVRAFRINPNRRTLAALSAASAKATPSLRQLNEDLGEVSDPLDGAVGSLSALVRGLRSASDADIPIVSDAARKAAEGIGHIEEPLMNVRDGLNGLHEGTGTDAEVLERIQEAVRQVSERE